MDDFDTTVAVIGSGPTGAMAARTLVAAGVPTTMLESGAQPVGGLVVRAFGRNVYRRTTKAGTPTAFVADGNPAPLWRHELSPGGLSNQWTCAVPRFAPADFDEGARLDERYRWPVSYDDLVPYYEHVERILRVVGSAEQGCSTLPPSACYRNVALPSAWRNVTREAVGRGQQFVPMPLAEGPAWQLKTGGTPFNSYTDIVRPLTASPHFNLQTNAHVLRLEQTDAGRVNRVIYYDRTSGCERSIRCRAVVLAAGPLSSTRLLLSSGCHSSDEGLGNDCGVLGRYLHDHAIDMAVVELGAALPRLGQPGYLTRSPYGQSEPLQAAGCLVGGRISQLDRLLTFTPIQARRFGVLVFGSMVPITDNRVSLHRELTDQYGQPQLQISLRYDAQVRDTTSKALESLVQILAAAGLKPSIRWRADVLQPGFSYHYGGTARMHASRQYGVTNAWGRLHAVDNVTVADASVFTTGVEKNPTLTAMALAMRSTTKLIEDLRVGTV